MGAPQFPRYAAGIDNKGRTRSRCYIPKTQSFEMERQMRLKTR